MRRIPLVRVRTLKELLTWVDTHPDEDAIFTSWDIQTIKMRLALVEALATDFAGTVTHDGHWDHVRELMPEAERIREDADRHWHRGRREGKEHVSRWWSDRAARGRTSTDVDVAGWVVNTTLRAARGGLTKTSLTSMGRALTPRQGFSELFRLFPHQRVIISREYQEAIEAFLRYHNWLQGTRVAAPSLLFDEEGRVVTLHPGSIVVAGNKGEAAQLFLQDRSIPEARLLTIGDGRADLESLLTLRTAINCFLLHKESVEKIRELPKGKRGRTWERIGIWVKSESLLPLARLIEEARREKMAISTPPRRPLPSRRTS